MVRAPPCHGGSCGFEPRLPRIFFVASLSLIIFFSSCSSESLTDFHYEGEAVSRLLIAELQQIRSRDDLLVHAPRLQELFNQLVDLMIHAQEFKDTHPNASLDVVFKEHSESDRLRIELNRVLHMEGGKEVLEKAQESALNHLDIFEKKRLRNQGK